MKIKCKIKMKIKLKNVFKHWHCWFILQVPPSVVKLSNRSEACGKERVKSGIDDASVACGKERYKCGA